MSTFELVISVSIFTPPALLRALEQDMKRYVESRAMDFVKDSFRIVIYEVSPGHCIKASRSRGVQALHSAPEFLRTLITATSVFAVLRCALRWAYG